MSNIQFGSTNADEGPPPNFIADTKWARSNYDALLAEFGDGIAFVYHQQVIGFGDTYKAACDDTRLKATFNNDTTITPVMIVLSSVRAFRHPRIVRREIHQVIDNE